MIINVKIFSLIFVFLLLVTDPALAKAKKVDEYHWTGVERVVAIADLHGDYEQYLNVMASAGLINKKGKWSGGQTHLVQTGDITDRGADSRKIIDHLLKLATQAKRKGGYIHMLIGNHEAMNVIGDLRYVSAGEYNAFMTGNSERFQEMQWKAQLEWMRANLLTFEELDLDAYRREWEKAVPLGWVEHRQAWSLAGDYGSWVEDNQVAIKINDTIYLHGGISSKYCKFSLQSLTEQVRDGMKTYDPQVDSIVDDPLGPLWYRGLAQEDETEEFGYLLDLILKRYDAKRIVIGHTPTGGVVWPRFDQRVVANDSGIAASYGAHTGILELTAKGATAIYGEQRIPLPVRNDGREDYLRAVIEADSNNAELKARLADMLTPVEEVIAEPGTQAAEAATEPVTEEKILDIAAMMPSPGICQ